MVKAAKKPLRQVIAFRDLESSVEQTGKAMREPRDNVRAIWPLSSLRPATQPAPSKSLTGTLAKSCNDLNA